MPKTSIETDINLRRRTKSMQKMTEDKPKTPVQRGSSQIIKKTNSMRNSRNMSSISPKELSSRKSTLRKYSKSMQSQSMSSMQWAVEKLKSDSIIDLTETSMLDAISSTVPKKMTEKKKLRFHTSVLDFTDNDKNDSKLTSPKKDAPNIGNKNDLTEYSGLLKTPAKAGNSYTLDQSTIDPSVLPVIEKSVNVTNRDSYTLEKSVTAQSDLPVIEKSVNVANRDSYTLEKSVTAQSDLPVISNKPKEKYVASNANTSKCDNATPKRDKSKNDNSLLKSRYNKNNTLINRGVSVLSKEIKKQKRNSTGLPTVDSSALKSILLEAISITDESFDKPEVNISSKQIAQQDAPLSPYVKKNLTSNKSSLVTSTPLVRINSASKNLLKNVLTSQNKNLVPVNKKSTVKKVPNFKLIHQKRFEQMESLDDHCKRKEERAKTLLSGHKPTLALSDIGKTVSVSSPKTKKQLVFEGTAETTYGAKKCDTSFSKLDQSKNESLNLLELSAISETSFRMQPEKNLSLKNSQIVSKTDVVINDQNKKHKSKEASGFSKSALSMKKLPIQNRSTKANNFTSILSQKNKENTSKSRFNIERNTTRKGELKKIVTKTREIDNVNKRRFELKGVRSNRRFDLLMKMRSTNTTDL